MANGTLANLSRSAFVRTPRPLASRVVHHLLTWPRQSTVLDPTAGEGDLLWPTLPLPGVRRFGIEISAERAEIARQELCDQAHILTSAVEAVHVPKASMSVVLANPPYFFTSGKRAEYLIISRAGESLLPGGILVGIIPARSAWDAVMIKHWCQWYEAVRVWKAPDRNAEASEAIETTFEDFTQIFVVGVRRAEAVEVDPVEYKRLQGYRWRRAESQTEGEGRWEGGTPPPELPTEPLTDPYIVPVCRTIPDLVVRRADEATLLEALTTHGAHRSPEWEEITCWPEEVQEASPSMPTTRPAHLAAALLNDALGGQTISGQETAGGKQVNLLTTAFISSEWTKLHIGGEDREKMREQGVIAVHARQWQDLPVLGVMDLSTGEATYYEGNAALAFLQPWLAQLAERVARLRPPLYLLNPADWELAVLTQFALDKRLPGASYPGLAPAQLHRVAALGRSLDVNGRAAIQGEPGTGKTRMGTATAARQAYYWRERSHEFAQHRQPAWVRALRRAWLKNPRTLAMLGLEPVYGKRLPKTDRGEPVVEEDRSLRQIVAYREIASGKLILPEDAGPRALPVLVATPKKVTKEYGREIQAAWPQAEVHLLNRYQDLPAWFKRCAQSSAPAVVGIVSHSLTRAYGCEWQPAVIEHIRVRHVPDLDPPNREALHEVRKNTGKLVGYRKPGEKSLILVERQQKRFLCPDCLGVIEAVPGERVKPEEESAQLAAQFQKGGEHGKAEAGEKEIVTSRVYFEKKPRWCSCANRRNQERSQRGQKPLSAALWTRSWRQDLQEKYPTLTFAQWSQAMNRLRAQAESDAHLATPENRVALLSAHPDSIVRLIDAALCDEQVKEHIHALALTYPKPADQSDLETDSGLRLALLALAKRHLVVRQHLVQVASHLLDWRSLFFREALERWQEAASTSSGKKAVTAGDGVRLQAIGEATADGRIQQAYSFFGSVPSSFSPYEYLYRFFPGCVALSIVDESHNGRGTSTDIARAHHFAMLSAQTHLLTSGTHYGGDILSFYHYWFRFHPQFWRGLGLTWKDSAKALKLFGVIQEWTKEYESDGRKGSGQTDVRVSTIPAPGLSSKLIPRRLTLLVYLTVLDVGAFMPPRIEIPELIPMQDPDVQARLAEAQAITSRVQTQQGKLQRERQRLLDLLARDESVRAELNRFTAHAAEVEAELDREMAQAKELATWAQARNLAGAHKKIVARLEKLSQERNQTARMGKGTIPRWFAALPCESSFTLEQTLRGT
jgi:hypothetical protein